MGWLRSRWTIVALVPAFFLGRVRHRRRARRRLGRAHERRGPRVNTRRGRRPGDRHGNPGHGAYRDVERGRLAVLDRRREGGNADASAGGATTDDGASPTETGIRPAPRGPSVTEIDYGRWDGIFDLGNPEIVFEFGLASVVGEFRYLGGLECPVGWSACARGSTASAVTSWVERCGRACSPPGRARK
jgi:hypothetical protein